MRRNIFVYIKASLYLVLTDPKNFSEKKYTLSTKYCKIKVPCVEHLYCTSNVQAFNIYKI